MNAPIVETLAIDNYEKTYKAWQNITADGGRIAKEFRAAEAELKRVLLIQPRPELHPRAGLLHNGVCYTLDGFGGIQRIPNVRNLD